MKAFIKLLSALFITITLLIGLDILAGPTIIRDNRITDLATTPLLGRGYSIGTNTFQSSCLQKATITEPSYDMEYYFSSGEDQTKTSTVDESSSEERKTNTYASSRRKSFFGFGGASQYSSSSDTMKSSKTTVIEDKVYYNYDVFVTIDLYSYYASLDEGKSRLSDSAITLLRTKDLPGFFSSCGPYYVRSIGRKARLISKFTYKTVSTKKDVSFESKLKTTLQTFSASQSWGWTRSSSESSSATDTNAQQRNQQFSQEASGKYLTITTSAFGLGKNEKATLISYDIESFKAAIKDAFLSMQNPLTGKVSSIEVVPWVENTEFQALIGLEKSEDEYKDKLGADGKPLMGTDGKPLRDLVKKGKQLYDQKVILNLNAEFLMEIERVDRNLMNMFYKAQLCRKNIDANWKKPETDNSGKVTFSKIDGFDAVSIVNHRFENKPKLLKDLDAYLIPAIIDRLLKKEKCFMYGKENDSDAGCGVTRGGASACIKTIMDKGIADMRYFEHDSCRNLRENMGDVEDEFVDYYCMPAMSDAQ